MRKYQEHGSEPKGEGRWKMPQGINSAEYYRAVEIIQEWDEDAGHTAHELIQRLLPLMRSTSA